jgi:carbon monoxide dehydrogenase subunit G
MRLEISGREEIEAPTERVWAGLIDPALLERCIAGCRAMDELARDSYRIRLELKVAAIAGTFEGQIGLSNRVEGEGCVITVAGSGSLGHGRGEARLRLERIPAGTLLCYQGNGEIGGLVAGVGQRVLRGVSKHLIGTFFKSLRSELAGPA